MRRPKRRPGSAVSVARHWRDAVLLGFLTVGAYGVSVYASGVLIEPVHDDTGWSVGWISAAFTVSGLAGGMGALGSGWLLDRIGARPVLLGSLLPGAALLLLASIARNALVFVVAWGLGGGLISAGLFYNITMALTARLYPGDRVRAFAVLTFVGGFAAVIYFPLAGVLVDQFGWRTATRALVVLMVAHVLPALAIRGGAAPAGAAATPLRGDLAGIGDALRSRQVVLMIGMFSLAAMAFGAIQVHHVPAMTAAGVSLGTATALASVRGFLSLPGRVLMEPAVRRTGVLGTLGGVYALMAIGSLPLAFGRGLGWLLVFTFSTGIAFGALSPLHGLRAAEVYGERRIGTLMGFQSLVVSLVSAMGPLLLGLTVDATGGYRLAILLSCGLFAAALALLLMARGQPAAGPEPSPAIS